MNNKYIRLPIIKEIEVKNYSLFKKNWEYEFKKGLNLFLGGNTLGKTTSVYIILYGITGIPKENMDFFIKRIKDSAANKTPTVRLKLELDKTIIEIERNLKDSNVVYLSINEKLYNRGKDDLNQLYNNRIISLSGFFSLDDYRFLLEKLLIREEEGNYLLWSPSDQARILRLLVGYEGFDKKFAKLERMVTDYDTKMRGQQDTQAQFKKRLQAMKDQKVSRLRELGAMDMKELEDNIQSLEKEKEKIIKQEEKLKKDIERLKQKREAAAEKLSLKSNRIEELDAEIMSLENEFFESIYSDPKILLAHHKLQVYGICMFCNQKPLDRVKNEIVSQIKRGRCPVCGLESPIKFDQTISVEKKKIAENIEITRNRLSELESELGVVRESLQETESELNKCRAAHAKLATNLIEIITKTDDFKLRLSDLKRGRIEDIAIYDRDIKTLQTQIDFYEEEVGKARGKYKDSIAKLKNLNREFEKSLCDLQQNMVKIFRDYAGTIFVQCDLDIHLEKPPESKIRLPVFLPKIDNILRKSLDQISKSEAIFLEYAFRMSLCELYNKITGNSLNLIIETSEGIFDLGVIEMLSDILAKFSRRGHYLLIVSNLGREDFLEFLIKKSEVGMKQRVVSFFDIGRLSKIQKDRVSKYMKTMDKIMAGSFEK